MQKSRLESEARSIMRELGLLPVLRQYGEARLVGSVALDLIVKRDIDFDLLLKRSSQLSSRDHIHTAAKLICAWLASRDLVGEPHIHDYMDSGGLKVGVEDYPGPSGGWTVDIWITDRRETTAFDLVERLTRVLTQAQRESIMRIKRTFCERDAYVAGLGCRIYAAVVDEGISTIGEFDRFLAQNG